MGMADRDRWIALGGAVAVHVVLFAVIAFGLTPRDKPALSAQLKPVIQASAVSEAQVMEPYRKRLEAEAAEQRRAVEAKRRAEEARRKAAAEKKRQAEEAARRRAEQARLAELKKQQEAEKARLAERERQRKIEAERKAAEAARKKAEAERQRQEAEAQARREAEQRLRQQMAAEAERLAQEEQQYRSARFSRLQNQYVAEITNKVQRNWLRPPDSRGSLCTVVINQLPGGEIVGVQVTDCDGDVAFQRSVEAAVRKASPLPQPPERELFQREIEFVFRPDR